MFGTNGLGWTSSPTSEAQPKYAFVAGWGEEVVSTYVRVQYLIQSKEQAETPGLHMYESARGEPFFMGPCPGHEESNGIEVGQGLLLEPHANSTPRDLLHNISESMLATKVVSVRRQSDQALVEALTFIKYFPSTPIPGMLIPGGVWNGRALPFPLISASLAEISKIRHIFGYGTLRADDTSGAGWTVPFNDGMTSQLATVRGVSLYLQGYPIVLIPRHEEHRNEGIIGRVVSCDSTELFSQKLCMADRIEDSPNLYRRGVVKAELKDGSTVLAFMYYRNLKQVGGDEHRFLKTRIHSGDFLRRGAEYEFICAPKPH